MSKLVNVVMDEEKLCKFMDWLEEMSDMGCDSDEFYKKWLEEVTK